MIFAHLSYDGFSSNASHLRVCKRWDFLGRAMFDRRLVVTRSQLACFMTWGNYPVTQARCAPFLDISRSLTIRVPPYVHPAMDPRIDLRFDILTGRPVAAEPAATTEFDKRWDGRITWANGLRFSLSMFANLVAANKDNKLQNSRSLHFTHVEPVVPEVQTTLQLPWPFTYAEHLRSLCLERLRSLTIEVASPAPSPFIVDAPNSASGHDFCTTPRKLLPTLHTLRLRLSKLCPEALDCILDDKGLAISATNSAIGLRTLIINLSDFSDTHLPSGTTPRSCAHPHIPRFGAVAIWIVSFVRVIDMVRHSQSPRHSRYVLALQLVCQGHVYARGICPGERR